MSLSLPEALTILSRHGYDQIGDVTPVSPMIRLRDPAPHLVGTKATVRLTPTAVIALAESFLPPPAPPRSPIDDLYVEMVCGSWWYIRSHSGRRIQQVTHVGRYTACYWTRAHAEQTCAWANARYPRMPTQPSLLEVSL